MKRQNGGLSMSALAESNNLVAMEANVIKMVRTRKHWNSSSKPLKKVETSYLRRVQSTDTFWTSMGS